MQQQYYLEKKCGYGLSGVWHTTKKRIFFFIQPKTIFARGRIACLHTSVCGNSAVAGLTVWVDLLS